MKTRPVPKGRLKMSQDDWSWATFHSPPHALSPSKLWTNLERRVSARFGLQLLKNK
jgi:hypothetical protein